MGPCHIRVMNNRIDRCFACSKRLGKTPKLIGCKDDQTAFVGSECFKCIAAAGEQGWQPPKGGPRLYLLQFTRHAA